MTRERAFAHEDYNSINYVREKLVPVAASIMGNVVPQTDKFNRGIWKITDEYIQASYKGMTIAKGCKYEGRKDSEIDIPEGCYWVVIDDNKIIDNGYMDQFTGKVTKELPSWANDITDFVPFHFRVSPSSEYRCLIMEC